MKVVGHKGIKMKIKGKSMEPTLIEGREVIIKSICPHEVKIGNVVIFKIWNKIFIHRIIGIHKINEELFFIEKGDNSSIISIFPQEVLLGKVCGVADKEIVISYNKQLINTYLLFTYPLFKRFCTIKQRLSSKNNKRLGEFIFYFYLIPFRFFSILPSIIKNLFLWRK